MKFKRKGTFEAYGPKQVREIPVAINHFIKGKIENVTKYR